jgi:hypothetical protein
MSSTAQQTLSGPTRPFKLFDSNSVGLATLIGGPVAGSFLMAINYRRLGFMGNAIMTLAVGAIVTGLAIMIGWNIPPSVTFPLALALLYATKWLAQNLQGPTVKYHLEHGGSLASRWTAFASGLGCMAVLFTVGFLATNKSGNAFAASKSVVIGTKDEVYYSGSATRQDAETLGNALKTDAYFSDRGADVLLDKGKDGTSLSFVVQDNFLSQPGILNSFEEVARQVAPTVGGFPVQLRLVNTAREVELKSTVGKFEFPGNDAIYYLGSVNPSEAQALGKSLQSLGYFEGRGNDVFLSRHKDGTAIAYVVSNGSWDKPAIVDDFEKITRNAAPSAGGLPISFRLVNTALEVKKEQLIQ